jgi:NADH:ubiquinone oxidoreductase subunit 6 (subunit J)
MNVNTSELREGHQTIAILAGGIGVLALGLSVVVMATEGRAYTPRQVATNVLLGAGVALGFYLTLLVIHVLQHIESAEDVRRRAQFERFLDMLREVRRLLRLNW